VPLGFPLALPLGGGPDDCEVEQDALLQALEPQLDPEDPIQVALTYGEGLAIAMIWAVNRRLKGQLDPNRMIETLPVWETACQLRPLPSDTDTDRRNALAARFLGYAGNALAQIVAAAEKIAGEAFVGFAVAIGDTTTYSPGINPGPPGFEWSSNRALLAIQLVRGGLPDAAFLDMMRRLRTELDILCPSWMTFNVGTLEPGGFVAGVGICGATLL
jgi:hypothetical protein